VRARPPGTQPSSGARTRRATTPELPPPVGLWKADAPETAAKQFRRVFAAATRRQGRQFVSHGHVTVNGRRVDIPSYEVAPGDVVAVVSGAQVDALARRAAELVQSR
jgi:23S rRNA-/tRNA-specific pseudouridylate synthase